MEFDIKSREIMTDTKNVFFIQYFQDVISSKLFYRKNAQV